MGDRSACSTSYERGSKTGLRQAKPPSRSQTCREICKTASRARTRKRPSLTRSAEPQPKHIVGRAGFADFFRLDNRLLKAPQQRKKSDSSDGGFGESVEHVGKLV